MRRTIIGTAVAVVLLTLAAGPAMAGGWATITPDTGGDLRPNAGQTVDIGFTVLQHGKTPASWVNANVLLTEAASGEVRRTHAVQQGAEGHFTAAVEFPRSGYWSWQVEVTDLEVEPVPILVTVLTADGRAPVFDAATAITIAERARAGVRSEIMSELAPRVENLEAQLVARANEIISLRRQLVEVRAVQAAAEPAGPAPTATSAPEPAGVPVAALIVLSFLAGTTGSIATALAMRRSGQDRDRTELGVAGAVPTTR
jgi:hypothetical protein